MRRIALALAALALVAAGDPPPRFANPLLASGADPWITREGATYYFMRMLGNRLAVQATTDLTKLAEARRRGLRAWP